jgi:uncharacterized protein (DUF2249 family)
MEEPARYEWNEAEKANEVVAWRAITRVSDHAFSSIYGNECSVCGRNFIEHERIANG